ncbi:unnamed protein product [Durusdinium trenchii]|uniref:Pentatricopeptide repeat-containing protein, chloroplastic n=2 Tax=Durusdinium trenchii TaxID=1381693 RepID=A0ABP0MEW3_9DINO
MARAPSLAVVELKSSRGWLETLQTFREVLRRRVEPNVIVYGAAIGSCKGNWPVSFWFLERLQQAAVKADAELYTSCINSCRKGPGRAWREVVALLKDLEAKDLQSDLFVYNGAISACEASNSWQEALLLLGSLDARRLEMDVVSLSSTLTVCERCKEWEMTLALLCAGEESQMQLNLITYNTAISSFGKARQWQMAVEFVFEGLGRRRMAPDLISYNSLLNGFGLAQQWMDALFLLEQMQELRVRADSFSYSATIHACGESSEWQQACELLSAAPLVTCVMENAAMEACCTASMWPQALSLFDGIDSPSAGSFKSALVAAKEGQQWLLALHLFSEMEKANKPRTVNAWNTVIQAVLSGASVLRALEVLKDMELSALATDDRMYAELIEASAQCSNWPIACWLMERGKLSADLLSQTSAIRACQQSQQWERGSWMLTQLQEAQLKTDVVSKNLQLSICKTAEQWWEALRCFQQMQEIDVISYTTAMSAFVDAGEWRHAVFLFNELESQRLKPAGMTYTFALSAVAMAFQQLDAQRITSQLERSVAQRLEGAQIAFAAAMNAGQLESLPTNAMCFWHRRVLGDQDWKMYIQDPTGQVSSRVTFRVRSHWHQAVVFFDASRRLGFDDEEADLFLLCALDKACHWSSCLQHLKSGRSGSEEELRERNVAINACSRELRWQRACTLLHQLPIDQMQGSLVSYHSALLSLPWRSGLEILELLGGVPLCSLDTCHAVLYSLRLAAAWHAALHLLWTLDQPVTMTYNMVLASSDWAVCLVVLENMLMRDLKPDLYTYASLLSAFVRAGRWHQCLHLLQLMRSQELPPDARLYSNVLQHAMQSTILATPLQRYRPASLEEALRRQKWRGRD